jgi:small conductance mechanosensitive channel
MITTEHILRLLGAHILPWLLGRGLSIFGIIIGAYIILRISSFFISRAVRRIIVADAHVTPEAEVKREDTLIRIISSTAGVMIVAVAFLMILSQVGVAIAPLIAAMGIAGVALGFGGQYLIRDIISGLFIILENQYRVGDIIKVGSVGGTVEDITLRMTTLRDLDGVVHHVPHGEVMVVSNLTKKFSRINMNIRVSYNSNIDLVTQIVNTIGEELSKDTEWGGYIISAPKFIRIDSFDDSAIIVKVLGDVRPGTQWQVAGELRKRLKKAFDEKGIEIPLPQVVVHKN